MNPGRKWTLTASLLGMLMLILDGKTALMGAQTGLELCIRTLIPSLFPFFVLSAWMTGSGFSLPFLSPLARLMKIPEGGEFLLIPSFLGGYPVGAQCIAQAWQAGALEKQDAQRLLAFGSNAGPAFLFGVTASLFPESWMVWGLWGIHIVSAVCTALVLPGRPGSMKAMPEQVYLSLPQALGRGIGIMGAVCGWVILFRVVMALALRWVLWMLPKWVQVLLMGLLELSNGCMELTQIPGVFPRFLLCSVLLSLGGVCVAMQTMSVTAGLSLRKYVLGKLMQTGFGIVFSIFLFQGAWYLVGILVFACICMGIAEIKGSIPETVGV